MSTLGAFVLVVLVVIVTPGQDTALTIKNSLAGRRGGVATAAGVSVGQAVWAVAAIVGRTLDAVTGVVLVALGLRLATKRR